VPAVRLKFEFIRWKPEMCTTVKCTYLSYIWQ